MKQKAVIFDMDGLLIDSEPFWKIAEKETFRLVGLELTTQMCEQTMGLRLDEVVEYWYSRHPWSNYSKKEISKKIAERVKELIEQQGELMPGALRALQMARELELKIALASASSTVLIDAVLNKFDLRSFFDVVHSAQFEEYGKPHPAVFLTTAQKLGVLPSECTVLEDSFYGVIAAKAARMKVIAVPDASHFPQLRFYAADVKIASLEELTPEMLTLSISTTPLVAQ
ncbi:MAG: hexitol phosphatase HxpB [Cytophagales bacterium]|nr:hexitol phosphatase HxpB [Cytophagales bacterium]MDW8384142.1 hexitol phosphatase HxpB [Flammeovirgaceae bacterium]